MPASLAHKKRMLAHLERQAERPRLQVEAERALTELRRVRDLFAQRDEVAEAMRINDRVKALKAAIEGASC